jgi:hypothetical protein
MTQTAFIYDMPPEEVMKVVRELRARGLVQGIHFDFRYNPGQWDLVTGEKKRSTEFTFYDGSEKWATLFGIKYS